MSSLPHGTTPTVSRFFAPRPVVLPFQMRQQQQVSGNHQMGDTIDLTFDEEGDDDKVAGTNEEVPKEFGEPNDTGMWDNEECNHIDFKNHDDDDDDKESVPNTTTTTTITTLNPFAQFAATTTAAGAQRKRPREHLISSTTASRNWAVLKRQPSANAGRCTNKSQPSKKHGADTSKCATSSKSKHKKPTEWIPMNVLPLEEQERIVQKWHSLIQRDNTVRSNDDGDNNNNNNSRPYSLEDYRFQLLLAARIHARCHEPAVRRALQVLNRAIPLTVQAVAQADIETLAAAISNLPHYNTKAQQIRRAAQTIQSEFKSQVPEQKELLLQLPGIGPVFADLLAFVNTRQRHAEAKTTSCNEQNPARSD